MPIPEAAVVRPETERDPPSLAPGRKPAAASLSDWVSLLKPRVISLVVFTGAVGVVLAPGPVDPAVALAAILCIASGAGAAGVLNMWYDRDIDAIMRRTSQRPIPAGRIQPADALIFGLGLAALSVLVLASATNIAAGAVLAGSIACYVLLYTMWLKRRTPQNIVWGGAAGALPPVIGWLAVSGSLGLLPVLMSAIVFCWTPAHFWSLSLYSHAEYRRAGVPMLPVVAGLKATRRQVLTYSVIVVAVSILPWAFHLAGVVYGLAAAALGLGLLISAWRVMWDEQDASGASQTRDAPARATFKYSILYLFALFAALGVDRLFI
jgi:protoheme IX farnesyltransferase